MAFIYAGGKHEMKEGIPASAFSRGDLLMLNSSSSLSRIDHLMPSGADIVGVAAADSTQSVRNKVPYLVPGPDTRFFIDVYAGSSHTVGGEYDVTHSSATGSHLTTSATSARVVVTSGTVDVTQSAKSRVIGKLIYHGGNIDLS